jgi:hypothetical protein
LKKAWHQQTKVRKAEFNGIKFDSKEELEFYQYLLSGKYRARIQNIELQPEYILIPKHEKNGRIVQPMKYRADFKITYIDAQGELVTEVIDVKGFPTDEFKLKKKILEYFFPFELIVIAKFPIKFGGGFGLLSDLTALQKKEAKDNGKPSKNGKSRKTKT